MFILFLLFGYCFATDNALNLQEEYPPTVPRSRSAQDFDETLNQQRKKTLLYLKKQLETSVGKTLIPAMVNANTDLNEAQKQSILDTIDYIRNNISIHQKHIGDLVNLLALVANNIQDIIQSKKRLGSDYKFLQHLQGTLQLLLRDVQEDGGVSASPSYSIFAGDLTASPTNSQILEGLRKRMVDITKGVNVNKNKEFVTGSALQAYRVVAISLTEIARELKLMFGQSSLKSALLRMPYYKASKEKLGWAYDMLNTPKQDKTDYPRDYGTKSFVHTLDDLRLALETYNPVQRKNWLERDILKMGARLKPFEELQQHRNKIIGLITVIKLSVAKIMALNEIKGYNKYFTEEYDKLMADRESQHANYARIPQGGALPQQPQGMNIVFNRDKDEIWILSLDGGGIRGIIGATVLDEISKKTGKHPAEIFDLFAGTSTGGIMAIGLTIPQDPRSNKPKNNTATLLSLYTTQGTRIFPPYAKNATFMKHVNQLRGFAYKADSLEGMFKQYFGEYNLSHAIKPVLVTSVSFSEGQSVTFSSRDGLNPRRDLPAWLAARATSAAPSYFPPVSFRYDGKQGVFVDGGITNNDPVYEALVEARKIYPKAKKINILSVGTGEEEYKYNPDAVATGLGGLGMSFLISIRDGEIRARKNMRRYSRELEGQGVHVNYIRLNPKLSEAIELDKVDKKNIDKLSALGRQTIFSPTFVPEVANVTKHSGNIAQLRKQFPIWSFPELVYTLCAYSHCSNLDELKGKLTQPGFNAKDPQSMGKPSQTSAIPHGNHPTKPQEFPGDHGIRVRGFDDQGRQVS